jgi:acetylornithine aminotransferase
MKTIDVYSQFPLQITRGLGTHVWDVNHNRYLDLYGGHAVISIGHSHPEFVNAITQQLQKIAFYSNSVEMPLQEKLADKLQEISGYKNHSLFMCNSGAEANENALKIASFITGRKKIVALKNSFHGRTSAAVACTDDTKIQAPINRQHQVDFVTINDIVELKEKLDHQTAAFIIEGIQGVAGIFEPDTAFLQAAEKICREKNIVLILDEIQSGFGRSGKFFAHEKHKIKADIITMAKGMGNGFPVAGLLADDKLHIKKGMLGTTFGGNYLACVAALTVLEIIEKEKLMANVSVVSEYLISKIKHIEGVKEVRGRGLMLGFDLQSEAKTIRNNLLTRAHIFTGSASRSETVRLLPPLCLSINEVDEFLNALQTIIQKKSEHEKFLLSQ